MKKAPAYSTKHAKKQRLMMKKTIRLYYKPFCQRGQEKGKKNEIFKKVPLLMPVKKEIRARAVENEKSL